ncbi:phosphatidylinositol 4,5-bisphosphate 5-phosphatase A-like [Ochlerotatus camptorhynchus]|uniref:phosphatidylinositol 4,5-bisphosphate 5-phosphatase A-like n=1 Tax=Ochlerotatus camptorhynchus TaxID=644619 RepID=UPI0031CF940E
MKQFNNPIAVAVVLISVLSRHVKCLPSSKSGSLSSSSSGSSSSSDGSQPLKDLKPDGTSFWSPQPEYYHERDRYSGNRPSDFVTSYGSFENKYGGSSSPSSSSSYGNKDRLGPFSTGSGGSYYSSGGVFDRKPYGPPQPVEYPAYAHEYDGGHYDNHYNQGHGFNLGQHFGGGGKDITKSILIPLAGAALLGIAAALVANPVLLHLGAFAAGKRKRRDVTANSHNLAYRAHLKPAHPLAPPKA